MRQYELIRGVFEPIETGGLRDGAEEYIGLELLWQPMWKLVLGEYRGDWAMVPVPRPDEHNYPFAWAPERDVRVVKVVTNELA